MTTINYKDKMTHSECDKIIGKPTYDTLLNLENQIIANTNCTSTPLGGGAHRYLGLAKSPTQYALISETAFIRPLHPGIFTPTPLGTAAQIETEKGVHKEAWLNVFNHCIIM